MKKKIFIIIAVLIIVIIRIIFLIFRNNNEKYNIDLFYAKLRILYKEAINNYEPGIAYYSRIDGISCEFDFYHDELTINYYIGFDDAGNINKIVAYDDYYKYENEKRIISIEDLYINKRPIAVEKGNFELNCDKRLN